MSRRMIDEGALNGMLGTALDSKQDKLKAGTNITIADDGTISARGGELTQDYIYVSGNISIPAGEHKLGDSYKVEERFDSNKWAKGCMGMYFTDFGTGKPNMIKKIEDTLWFVNIWFGEQYYHAFAICIHEGTTTKNTTISTDWFWAVRK